MATLTGIRLQLRYEADPDQLREIYSDEEAEHLFRAFEKGVETREGKETCNDCDSVDSKAGH